MSRYYSSCNCGKPACKTCKSHSSYSNTHSHHHVGCGNCGSCNSCNAGGASLEQTSLGYYTYNDGCGNSLTFRSGWTTASQGPNGELVFLYPDGSSTNIGTCCDQLSMNEDGTYTWTNFDGTTFILDSTHTPSSFIDHGDGTYTHDNGDGQVVTFHQPSSITTNGVDTYTHHDGLGNAVTWITGSTSFFTDNGNGTVTHSDGRGNLFTFRVGWTELQDDGAGNYTLVYPDGTSAVLPICCDQLSDNGDGTYTWTNQDGTTFTVGTGNTSSLIDNGDGTYTHDDGAGNTTIFQSGWTTVAEDVNGDTVFTYPDGTTVTITDCCDQLTDNGNGTYTWTNDDGTTFVIDTTHIPSSVTFDGTDTWTHDDGQGTTVSWTISPVDQNSVSTLTDNGDGTVTHDDGLGNTTTFQTGWTTVTEDVNGDTVFTYPDGSTVVINDCCDQLVDNGDGTYTWTNEDGTTFIVDTTHTPSSLTDNGDGTYTHDNGDGVTTTFQTGWTTVAEDVNGDTVFTYPDGSTVVITDCCDQLTDNGDGTYTWTNEDGTTFVVDTTHTPSSVTFDGVNTYTHDDGAGNTVSWTIAPGGAISSLTDNGDGTVTHDDGAGNTTTFNIGWTTVAEDVNGDTVFTYPDGTTVVITDCCDQLADNGDGTYTWTNEDGTTFVIDTTHTPSSLTDNTDGTWTHDDGAGTTATFLIPQFEDCDGNAPTTAGTVADPHRLGDCEVFAAAAAPTADPLTDAAIHYDMTDPDNPVMYVWDDTNSVWVEMPQGCCLTFERCDPANGNAIIYGVQPLNPDGSQNGAATYYNGDLTPFAGDPLTLVDCPSGAGSISSITDNGDSTYLHDDGDGNTTTIVTERTTAYVDPATGDPAAPGGASSIQVAMDDGTLQSLCEGGDGVIYEDICPVVDNPQLMAFYGGRDGKNHVFQTVGEHRPYRSRIVTNIPDLGTWSANGGGTVIGFDTAATIWSLDLTFTNPDPCRRVLVSHDSLIVRLGRFMVSAGSIVDFSYQVEGLFGTIETIDNRNGALPIEYAPLAGATYNASRSLSVAPGASLTVPIRVAISFDSDGTGTNQIDTIISPGVHRFDFEAQTLD